MQPSTKSLLMLLGMLALGAVLGAAGAVMVVRRPAPPPHGRDAPGGFVAHMERTIQPTDSAQRAAIHPILEAIDRQNRDAVDRSRAAMRASLDSMLVALSPLLDPPQRDRLVALIRELDRRPPPGGRGPPGPPER